MTLGRKLILTSSLLVLALVVVGTVPLWGISGLGDKLDLVVEEFEELAVIGEVDRQLSSAYRELVGDVPDTARAVEHLRRATDTLDRFLLERDESEAMGAMSQAHLQGELGLGESARRYIDAMVTSLEARPNDSAWTLDYLTTTTFNDASSMLETLTAHAQSAVDAAHHDARRQVRQIRAIMIGSILVIALTGAAVAIWQFRQTMGPLRRLQFVVEQVAAGNFSDRLPETGEKEFIDLTRRFNRMAAELDELYSDLESRVETKSRQLVRSERLASVGFLAAGVAHEINNPLGIIAGYADLLLKRASRMPESADRAQLEEFLTIVRDEVFRCKHVTQKLLSLSRSDPESRSRLNVATAAREVVRLVRGVEKFADRVIEVEAADNGRAEVIGSDQEIRQLLLNLVVNALEATEPGRGRVTIHVTTAGDDCRIEVTDNGCGMSAETLDRVFEPFYTERAGGDEAGTGLGLSVSHAIITAHGGRIWAESAGPGRGSTFIVVLPLASEVAV